MVLFLSQHFKILFYWKIVLVVIVFCGFNTTGYAQSCNGVLGEAIINETFGTSVLDPLEAGQTTYRFVSDRCPGDGEYMLANSVYCYGGTWHNVPEDHTPGDVNGVMTVVNASYDAGEFYSHSVSGLCNGITYEFSVWVLNIMNPISTNGCNPLEPVPLDPNITMKIERTDGTTIQVIQTGLIGRSITPTWIRYAVLFTMPENENTVIIKLINNGTGGCGNDLALDDIQFRPCHPILQINFEENSNSNLAVCENTTHRIKSTLGPGYSQPVYQWQVSTDSLSWQNIANATTDSYLLPVNDRIKRFYRLVCTQYPNVIIEQNTQCRSVSNAVSTTLRDPNECSGPQIHIPDSFTPNHDGINDVLNVYHPENTTFELRIYNRWGSVIFITDTNGLRWDGTHLGKPCQEGSYPWKINYQLDKGTNPNTSYVKTGQVTLFR